MVDFHLKGLMGGGGGRVTRDFWSSGSSRALVGWEVRLQAKRERKLMQHAPEAASGKRPATPKLLKTRTLSHETKCLQRPWALSLNAWQNPLSPDSQTKGQPAVAGEKACDQHEGCLRFSGAFQGQGVSLRSIVGGVSSATGKP